MGDLISTLSQTTWLVSGEDVRFGLEKPLYHPDTLLPNNRWKYLTFFFFLGPSVALGSSGIRGQVGTAAASLQHTGTATPDPSYICDLCRSSWQHQILNPLNEAWEQTPHPHGYLLD